MSGPTGRAAAGGTARDVRVREPTAWAPLMRAVAGDCLRRGVRARWRVRAENAGAIRFYERLGASVAIRGVRAWAVPAMRVWVAPDGDGAG